jgi:hypothetical protein
MTTTQIEFISVNPGSILSAHDENRKKVRIQVMKDFRRKERERQGEMAISRTLTAQVLHQVNSAHSSGPTPLNVANT